MEITDVRVKQVEDERKGNLLAVASITIDNAFAVHNIKVIQGTDGPFIAMPSKRGKDDKFWDIAHPINSDARKIVSDAIINEYQAQYKWANAHSESILI